MVALQPRVVGQNFARRQTIRGAAQCAGPAAEHDRREPNAEFAQFAPQFWPVLFRRHEMAAIGHEAADFFGHAPAQLRIAAAKSDHHGLGIFAQQPEEQLLEALLHSTDLDSHNAAQAALGVSAAMVVTGP